MSTPYHDVAALRAECEAAHIVHLVAAARAAGLRFRNGPTKADLIARLTNYPAMLSGTVAALRRIQRMDQTPKQPAPMPDWINDDDDAPVLPTPTLTPPVQPSTVPMDLSEYAKRQWAREEILAAEGRSTKRVDALQANVTGLAGEVKALQELRPVVFVLPNKPDPIKVDGLVHAQFSDLLIALSQGEHCMLVGGAGSGKTYASEQAAIILGRRYFKQPPASYTFEILGNMDSQGRYVRTATRDAIEFGGLICYDEADASSPDALLALNAVLDNSKFVAFPDGLIEKHPDFVAMVCTNTDGSGATMQYAGRQRQDGSTLDRVVMYHWEIDPRIETMMAAGNTEWLAVVRAVRKYVTNHDIQDVIATARATQKGSRLLHGGMDRAKVLERLLKRGALREAWTEVCTLPVVSNFLRG